MTARSRWSAPSRICPTSGRRCPRTRWSPTRRPRPKRVADAGALRRDAASPASPARAPSAIDRAAKTVVLVRRHGAALRQAAAGNRCPRRAGCRCRARRRSHRRTCAPSTMRCASAPHLVPGTPHRHHRRRLHRPGARGQRPQARRRGHRHRGAAARPDAAACRRRSPRSSPRAIAPKASSSCCGAGLAGDRRCAGRASHHARRRPRRSRPTSLVVGIGAVPDHANWPRRRPGDRQRHRRRRTAAHLRPRYLRGRRLLLLSPPALWRAARPARILAQRAGAGHAGRRATCSARDEAASPRCRGSGRISTT